MAVNVNRVTIAGRVGADPEVKGGRNSEFVTMRVATSRTWKDRDGNKQEKTEWHSVTLFAEPAAKFAKNYIKKGDFVFIEGRLETSEYEKDGERRFSTNVVVAPFDGNIQSISKDGNRNSDSDRGSDRDSSRDRRSDSDYGSKNRSSGGGRSQDYDIDDEIPF